MTTTANVLTQHTSAPDTSGGLARGASIAAHVLLASACVTVFLCLAGCTTYQIREHPTREVATMEIKVVNPDGTTRWKKVMRTVHEFDLHKNSRENER